ncbi:MAG: hypothetical protein QOJ51_5771 [Acidobacteriaceae bacterium]|jgi:hypothetical protein|nr:hypothetical protein [Acidobacteriaceae bacterium]MEA2262946.1 hypothetical protein [Acidobacteriaceae bacterium]
MNPTLARFLTGLYPPAWRKRYGAEFKAFLETERLGFGTPFEVAWFALAERFHPTHEVAKEHCFATHVVRPWWRAPSAVFFLAPVPMLAGAYAVACLILWAGWRMFIPGSDSPFGARTHGVANLYFQAGKYYYFAAPVLVGWWLEIMAIRLRVKAVWLAIGLLLVAWMGTAARIDANRGMVHGEFGHISMSFDFFSLIPNAHQGMLHAATILLLAGFPYLLSRLHRSESIS